MLFKFLVILVTTNCANTANILGVFPMPGVSHYILDSKLMKGLAEAGHNVTMISPYELKDLPKNGSFTDVVLDGLAEEFQMFLKSFNLFEMDLSSPWAKMQKITNSFIQNNNKTLHHPKVKELIQSSQKFDVVIMEQFSNDALKVFSYIFNCPLILLSSSGPHGWVNPTVGNPQPVSTVPHLFFKDFSNDPSLLNRGKNLMFYLLDYIMTTYYAHPKHDQIMHQAYPDAPPLYDLYTNSSEIRELKNAEDEGCARCANRFPLSTC